MLRSPASPETSRRAHQARRGRQLRTSHRHRPGRGVAALAMACAFVVGLGVVPAAATDTPTSSIAARNAALWLASQVGPDGTATSPFSGGQTDISSTLDIALSLAATGVDKDAFDRAMGWIVSNTDEVIAPDGATSGPGTIGVLLMLAATTGSDPTNFGGVNLIAALSSTLGLFEPGLYGALDPTFDGVFRQSLAIIGLVAVGQTPPESAVDWLVAQRCAPGGGDPLSDGGWMAYRELTNPCTAPDPLTFSGADNDSTSLAVMALAAMTSHPELVTSGVEFLARWQETDGGFAWFGGSDAVPNSTSLVIAALVSAGEDPTVDPWVRDGVDPVMWLEAQQIPCGQDDAGALTSIYSDGGPDQFATRQAVYGLAMVSFPLAPVTFETGTAPCGQLPVPEPPVTTTTAPAAPPAPVAASVQPRFTG